VRIKPRRIIGLSILATALIWFQAASRFEASRIDAQRQTRAAGQTAAASLRIDSDRLMAAVTTLADPKFEGRAAGSPGGVAARAWIVDRVKEIGLQPISGGYVQPFTYTRMTMSGRQKGEGANIVGMCRGTDATLPYFVVSAHYDHLGIRNEQIYPGADDDASGVAVVLELAAYCQKTPFRHSIVFAVFDAEEPGLQGAKAFLIKPPIPKDRIALNVNLDMVSRNDKREIFIAGTYHYPDLKPPLEDVARRAPITVLFGHDKPVALAGGVEDHADYHKPTDTADKIDRGFFVDVAETILDSVLALDKTR
jgi:hypothetical protein